MENKYLVEECFTLTPRDVGRRFDRIRRVRVNKLEWNDKISYWFDDIENPEWLFISVSGNEPQRFKWELVDITFGEKQYFYCQCGYRAMKLYLLPNGKEFKCRKCHNLQYQLTTYSKNSIAGKSLYRLNRFQKLSETRMNLGRILYEGNFTKKFERFLRLCDRAGYDSIVKGANDLRELIKQ